MSKISLQPNASGAGTFSIVAPDSNTNRTLTLPDESGSVLSDVHAAKTGDVHGIPANERAIHSEELRAAVSEAADTAEAVSMTGKGAIVESGSTPDGHYVRWEDGQIASFIPRDILTRDNIDINILIKGVFTSGTQFIDLPIEYNQRPGRDSGALSVSDFHPAGDQRGVWTSIADSSTNQVSFNHYCVESQTGRTMRNSVTVWGF